MHWMTMMGPFPIWTILDHLIWETNGTVAWTILNLSVMNQLKRGVEGRCKCWVTERMRWIIE